MVWKATEQHKFWCIFEHGVDCKTRCFMSGCQRWGFVSGLQVPN